MKITSVVSTNLSKRGNRHFKSRVVYSYPNNDMSQNLKDRIDDFEEHPDCYKKLGQGKSAEVYLLYPNDFVIKRQLPTYTKGDNFKHEAIMLEKVPSAFSHSQQLKAQVRTEKDNHYLVSTYVDGNSPNVSKNPLKEKDIENIFDSLFELDKAKIYHFDLNNNNILLTQDGANIIDYQWAQSFDYYDSQYYNNQKGIIFPSDVIPNNVQNYESTGFASYLYDYYNVYGKDNTRDFIKKYLLQKAKYFEKRHDYFRKTAKEDGIYYNSQGEFERTGKKHNPLVYLPIKYERALQKVYENPNDDVIDIEITRIEMLKADKKAYYYIDPNIEEKRNPFNAVPYYANSIISLNTFRKILNKFEDKYKGDKYMSSYIEYNQKVAQEHKNAFASWYNSSFYFLHRISKNELHKWETDRRVSMDENKLKIFKPIVTLDGILSNSNKKRANANTSIEILLPKDDIVQNAKNSMHSLVQESGFCKNEEDRVLFDEFENALNKKRQIDALCISFVLRRFLEEKNKEFEYNPQIITKLTQATKDIDLYISDSTSKLINLLDGKEVPDIKNDFKLSKIKPCPKIETQAKPISAETKKPESVFDKIKRWWGVL